MTRHIFTYLFIAVFSLLLIWIPAIGGSAIPSSEYKTIADPGFPEVLNIGTVLECGDFKIQVMGQPVVTKSSNSMIADGDMKYLIVRVGITNLSEQRIGWLSPDSFQVQEVYLSHAYGIYSLDSIMSAKASVGFSQPPFFTLIEAGKMVQTTLVFEVFPEAQGWILSFTPKTVDNDTELGSVQFTLPKALIQ